MSLEITAESLKRLEPLIRDDRASSYAAALEAIRQTAGLTTPARVRHFMAQIAHETAGFRALVESTDYKDPAFLKASFSNVKSLGLAKKLVSKGARAIGNCIYANRLGNGDEASGDGYRYRGRGFIMVTGRNGYRDAQVYSHLPLLSEPERLADPATAAKVTARYWMSHNINAAADAGDIEKVTELVNGPALLGLDSRKAYLARAAEIWT
jgi:putative chitinase